MEDSEVVHEIWNAKIPVQFVLSSDEVLSVEKPKPCYLLVSRISYFALVAEKLAKYFAEFVEKPTDDASLDHDLWLDHDGVPLKWHYPVGVLFDQLRPCLDADTEVAQPLQLGVHFKAFPEADVMRLSKDLLEACFMQTVKEADQLKHHGQIISQMQKRDHKQLWSGLCCERFEQFWSVNRRLMENTDREVIRSVPVRLYLSDQPYVQRLCRPWTECGQRTTLAQFLDGIKLMLPEAFIAVSHGVQLPLETPMLWLCENFAYPDNFVHVCIQNSPK